MLIKWTKPEQATVWIMSSVFFCTGSKKCIKFTFTSTFIGSVVAELKRNVVSPLLTPTTMKGLVKLWKICVVRALPGVQIDSKADHNCMPKLEAALPWWRWNLTCSSYDSNSCLPPRALSTWSGNRRSSCRHKKLAKLSWLPILNNALRIFIAKKCLKLSRTGYSPKCKFPLSPMREYWFAPTTLFCFSKFPRSEVKCWTMMWPPPQRVWRKR